MQEKISGMMEKGREATEAIKGKTNDAMEMAGEKSQEIKGAAAGAAHSVKSKLGME